MTRHDVQMFTDELTVLAEIYGRPVSEALGVVYFEALREYALADVIRALRCHVKHPEQGRFFPKPADLIAMIDGDTNSQALEAYQVLDDALLQYGVYRSVRFEDAALAATVKALGGWIEIEARWKDREQEPYLRADFCKLYRVYTARGLDRALLPDHFAGLHELSNQVRFPKDIPRPVVVGRQGQRAITSKTKQALMPSLNRGC